MRKMLTLCLATGLISSTLSSELKEDRYFQKRMSFLSFSEEFSFWDKTTIIETEKSGQKNHIRPSDSLLFNYSERLSEWDRLAAEGEASELSPFAFWDATSTDVSPFAFWDSVTTESAFAFWDAQSEPTEEFGFWDKATALTNTYHSEAFNRWVASKSNKKFDYRDVRPWSKEEGLAYNSLGGDLSASATEKEYGKARTEALLNIKTALWSNRLAITPYKELAQLSDPKVLNSFINTTIKKSFNIRSTTNTEEVNKKLDRYLDNDVSIYSSVSYKPLRISNKRLNFAMEANADLEVNLPGDLLGIVFTGALKPGATLDISDLSVKEISSVTFTGGGKWSSEAPDFLKFFTAKEPSLLKKVVNVDVILGLNYAEFSGKKGDITISEDGTSFSLDGDSEFYTSGNGLSKFYDMANPFENGFSPTGFGLATDIGFELASKKRAFSFYLNNLGAIRWKDVKKGSIAIKGENLDMLTLVTEGKDAAAFQAENGGTIMNSDRDTLISVDPIWRPAKTQLSLGVVQMLHNKSDKKPISVLSKQARVYAEYTQGLSDYAGNSYVPRIKTGIENDMFRGAVSTGYFFIGGGSENLASIFDLRLFNSSAVTLKLEYTAFGSPVLFPKRGFGVNIVTGFYKRSDKWL